MIGFLEGTVLHIEGRFALIMVGGVGYKVFVTTETQSALKKQKEKPAKLWTYLAVREDALDLYGFLEKKEQEFFELLITISGIGPKSALNILSVTTIENLRRAIASGETAYLTKISGIGRKIADKIVLELKDKIDFLEGEEDSSTVKEETDALEGLKALGYGEREGRDALKKLPKDIAGTSARLKAALKLLGK